MGDCRERQPVCVLASSRASDGAGASFRGGEEVLAEALSTGGAVGLCELLMGRNEGKGGADDPSRVDDVLVTSERSALRVACRCPTSFVIPRASEFAYLGVMAGGWHSLSQ